MVAPATSSRWRQSPPEKNSCGAFLGVCLAECECRPSCDSSSGRLRNHDGWLRGLRGVRTLWSVPWTATGPNRVDECGCRESKKRRAQVHGPGSHKRHLWALALEIAPG